MHRRILLGCAATLLLAGVVRAQEVARPGTEAPELRDVAGWVNSKPLTLRELRGQVVVLHFWTFG